MGELQPKVRSLSILLIFPIDILGKSCIMLVEMVLIFFSRKEIPFWYVG